jgi:hypothetical protein
MLLHHFLLLPTFPLFLFLLVITSPFLTLVTNECTEESTSDSSGFATPEFVATKCTSGTSG